MTYKVIKHVPTRHYNTQTHIRLLAEAVNELITTLIPNSMGVKRVTSATTLDSTMRDVYCDTDSAAITITLPPGADWKEYRIINTGTSGNNVTITPNGSEKLLGVNSTMDLFDGDVLIIRYEVTAGWW